MLSDSEGAVLSDLQLDWIGVLWRQYPHTLFVGFDCSGMEAVNWGPIDVEHEDETRRERLSAQRERLDVAKGPCGGQTYPTKNANL